MDSKPIVENTTELRDILESDLAVPVKPQRNFKEIKNKKSAAYKYYQKVRPLLAEWWMEFNTSLNDRGSRQYSDIQSFIRAKTKTNALEKQYLMEMIGTEPEFEDGEEPRVPWLGDWYERRENGFWSPDNPAKYRELVTAVKTKVQSIEAVRSAAPVLVQILTRYMRLHEQVDRAFGGQAFDLREAGPTDEQNVGRFNLYKGLHDSIAQKEFQIIDKWMQVHGVNPEEPQNVLNINVPVLNNQTEVNNTQINTQVPVKELQLLKLAQQLQSHSDRFKMPLPERLNEPEKKVDGVKVQ